MRLSSLQKYILVEIESAHLKKYHRKELVAFYSKRPAKQRPEEIQDVITKSIERLIDKGLLIGYGHRTTKKWFIEELRPTPLGRKTAKQLMSQQQSLPLFKRAIKRKE
ncbi:MAG: hypothetical protein V1853_03555 [bacterium]